MTEQEKLALLNALLKEVAEIAEANGACLSFRTEKGGKPYIDMWYASSHCWNETSSGTWDPR